MPSGWGQEDRGAYTSVAQSDDASAGLAVHEKEVEHESPVPADDHANEPLSSPHEDDTPTAEDYATLPKVADKLPWGAFLVAIVELCERFAYYGLSGPFQNYMANQYNDPNGLPGALGLKQSRATALSNFFQFWCYVTPILGAIVADQYLGKYLTIKYFSVIYILGIAVLFATSLPYSIEHGGAFPGLITAMVIIGLGTGGIKSNVSPLIAEQVLSTRPFVKHLTSGKRVVVDPEVTVQRIYMIYYMCINVGSISAIATTTLELHVGFWAAFFLPLVMFIVGFWVLVAGRKNYVIKPPQGGVINHCLKALWIASQNRFDLESAKPSLQGLNQKKYRITWDDRFIDELKTALLACKVFLFFPIYWLTFSQMMNNFVSQAGQMQLHGLPNDILPNIDPIALIIFIPIVDRIIYPFIRTRLHIAFTPITRITWGFIIASLSMAYAAILQSRIYASAPCFSEPSNCEAGKIGEGRYEPNQIHVAWQAPAYVLVALSEILASITGLELAYAKAPENMKSFIMSLFLLTSAAGSALGIFIAPFGTDPHLVWFYGGLAIAAGMTGIIFHWVFRGVNEGVDARNKAIHVESAVEEEIELLERQSREYRESANADV